MITTDVVRIFAVGSPAEFSRPMERDRAQQWLDENAGRGPVQYELRTVPTCECCGDVATHWFVRDNPKHARCRKHQDRNPCLVEGCRKTGKVTHGWANDLLICGAHWREFVPVGSPERRIYNRFFRRAKKYGWADELPEGHSDSRSPTYAAFHRFWGALVIRVRARARGDIDMDEVNRIMGWAA